MHSNTEASEHDIRSSYSYVKPVSSLFCCTFTLSHTMALLRVNTPPPPFAMPTTPRSMRKLPRTPATPPMTATNLWTESVWNDDEFRNRDAERPAAIDQIMRRSTTTTTTACTRRGERAADIDTAIQWIRSELVRKRRKNSTTVHTCMYSYYRR